ncbi:MAG: citrate transporter [Bacteroidetes bacterium]|nr:citrate transporter [Bacteroidota bacterium]MBU2586146.1 citrate transporter [Bacteroidota bacterium]
MQILQIVLLAIVFLSLALLMFLRKIPALLALPFMAFLIPIICGVSITDTIQYVIGQGSLKLHNAYTIAMFGSMLSIFLQKTGIAESFIKKGAELSGDKPWTIAVIMLAIIILLFTTLNGLGAIIMVATIVLPIMSSVGIGSMTIVGIFLIGLSIGGTLNAGNWAVYIDVMNLTVAEVRSFALVMFGLTFIAALIYITIQLFRDGHELNLKKIFVASLAVILFVTALAITYNSLSVDLQESVSEIFSSSFYVLKILLAGGIILLFALIIFRLLFSNEDKNKVHWTAYFTPILPLLLILIFEMNFIAAFISGLIYGLLSSFKKGIMNTFIRSIFEGGSVVMPAVVLMLGIGMLLNAIMGPGGEWNSSHPEGWPVLNLLKPLMMKIVPENPLTYVLTFTLAAPLALYRGPLNVWGMGYGLAAVFLASGMNPASIMGLLLAVGQIQGISDPTNTHNVWLANEMRVDVQKVLWNTIPYTWALAFVGLIASALMFMN